MGKHKHSSKGLKLKAARKRKEARLQKKNITSKHTTTGTRRSKALKNFVWFIRDDQKPMTMSDYMEVACQTEEMPTNEVGCQAEESASPARIEESALPSNDNLSPERDRRALWEIIGEDTFLEVIFF
ncbi:13940_t:CDS:2 [Funneliformis geosporum]|uniref:7868_t:CDS:1 n=1 Tax=Funneliformis geosporum TaxID=1117311 RepID=A0A9W4SF11_9GLOM|nr:7868_t:CDS:2 [Funneliformis geosporum]CAI2176912.1 13940_t:CDS:2 [Funneliformis geosporum]